MKRERTHFTGASAAKDKEGMTLVETVIAIALLSITFAGAFKALLSSMELADIAAKEATVTQIAKSRIERLSIVDFNKLPLFELENQIVNAEGVQDANGTYRLSTAVDIVTTNAATIEVEVCYRNRKSGHFDYPPKSFSFTRYE